jgi:CDGSH-type Zn-finger protein/uncharacterized Fe-S cluster protein YjdI
MADQPDPRDVSKTYTGQDIDVKFETTHCIHSAECIRRLGEVFDVRRKPWVLPDGAKANEVAAAVAHCPTGALQFTRHDNGPAEPTEANSIETRPSGPLYVRGDIRVETPEGVLIREAKRVALCRCGQSANKPFCDNTHARIGFRAQGKREPGEEAKLPEMPKGKLTIVVQPKKSLAIKGPFEVKGNDDVVFWRGEEQWFCRCGHSEDKPFCDGHHKQVEFDV